MLIYLVLEDAITQVQYSYIISLFYKVIQLELDILRQEGRLKPVKDAMEQLMTQWDGQEQFRAARDA